MDLPKELRGRFVFHVGQGVYDDGCMGCVDCMYIHTMSSCTTGELTTLLSQEEMVLIL